MDRGLSSLFILDSNDTNLALGFNEFVWYALGIALVVIICYMYKSMAKQEKEEQFHLRLPKTLKAKLKRQAREQRRSLNQYLVVRLEEVAEGQPKEQAVAA
jgi:HicB family